MWGRFPAGKTMSTLFEEQGSPLENQKVAPHAADGDEASFTIGCNYRQSGSNQLI